jgi:hypothetical protein
LAKWNVTSLFRNSAPLKASGRDQDRVAGSGAINSLLDSGCCQLPGLRICTKVENIKDCHRYLLFQSP